MADMKKIRYCGSKDRGYTAKRGMVEAEVRRVNGEWEGSY